MSYKLLSEVRQSGQLVGEVRRMRGARGLVWYRAYRYHPPARRTPLDEIAGIAPPQATGPPVMVGRYKTYAAAYAAALA